MPNSYTALPATPPIDDWRPPGWNPIWPYPGVAPPGYTPSHPNNPTAFDSADDEEPGPAPEYRVRYAVVYDYVLDGPGAGGYNVDAILQMATFIGSTESPFAFFTELPEFNWAWAETMADDSSPYLEFDNQGAGYSAGGQAGVSGYLDFDDIVSGKAYLLEMWIDANTGGFRVILSADFYRTPWIETTPGQGDWHLGTEVLIGSYERPYEIDYVGGTGIFTPGYLNIQRTATGLLVTEQWATNDIPNVQYLI